MPARGCAAPPPRTRRACPSTIRHRGSGAARTGRRSRGCPGSMPARGTRSWGSISLAQGARRPPRYGNRRPTHCRSRARRARRPRGAARAKRAAIEERTGVVVHDHDRELGGLGGDGHHQVSAPWRHDAEHDEEDPGPSRGGSARAAGTGRPTGSGRRSATRRDTRTRGTHGRAPRARRRPTARTAAAPPDRPGRRDILQRMRVQLQLAGAGCDLVHAVLQGELGDGREDHRQQDQTDISASFLPAGWAAVRSGGAHHAPRDR